MLESAGFLSGTMARIYLDDYVVEYNLSQQSFNVLTLGEMLRQNGLSAFPFFKF